MSCFAFGAMCAPTRISKVAFGCIAFTSGQTCTVRFDWSSTVCKTYNYDKKVV